MIPLAAAFVLVVVLGVIGFKVVDKKRDANGALVYPLWRCNLILLWMVFSLLCGTVVGVVSLPKYVALTRHYAQGTATISSVEHEQPCNVLYGYMVGENQFGSTESYCGLKAGQSMPVYYDTTDPNNSSLYSPVKTLRDEAAAIAVVSIILGAFIVLWFRMTHIVGKREKL